jgi:hypothetical protein
MRCCMFVLRFLFSYFLFLVLAFMISRCEKIISGRSLKYLGGFGGSLRGKKTLGGTFQPVSDPSQGALVHPKCLCVSRKAWRDTTPSPITGETTNLSHQSASFCYGTRVAIPSKTDGVPPGQKSVSTKSGRRQTGRTCRTSHRWL